MMEALPQVALAVFAVVLAISWHEAAHGLAALWLGDDTALRLGRVSLNPLRHVDRFGTIVVPGALLLTQLALIGSIVVLFGWAKPVPVQAWRFPHPRRGMALVAAAGPASNFLLAWGAGLLLHGAPLLPEALVEGAQFLLLFLILANLVMGMFNLLPIPPLDGGRIVVGLLPPRAARAWAGLERVGLLVVVAGVFVLPRVLQEAGVAFDPLGQALDRGIPWALGWLLRLSFDPPAFPV